MMDFDKRLRRRRLTWDGILAIASDTPLATPGVTRMDLSDTPSIAAFILANAATR